MSDERLAALRRPLAPVVGDGTRAWIVGGGLRDALLGSPVDDVDLAVVGDAAAPAARLARAWGASRFRLSREFGAWRVSGGRLPFQVDITPLQGSNLEEDLRRRDLTVNAIAAPVGGGPLIDPLGGLSDLDTGVLRAASQGAFRADPVRLVRVARFAEQLGFSLDPGTRSAAVADAGELWRAPGERLMQELGRVVALERADRAVRDLDAIGVLGALAPSLEDCRGVIQSPYHHLDVLGHTLEVVEHAVALAADPEPVFGSVAPRVAQQLSAPLADGLSAREGLVLAAIFHDMAKAATRTELGDGRIGFMGHDALGADMVNDLFLELRTSTRLRETVALMVRRHLPLGFLVHRTPLSLRQIDRYLRSTAPAEIEVIALTVADRLATAGPRTTQAAIRRHLVLAREIAQIHFRLLDRGPVQPLVGGHEIAMAVGREPGPWLGDLLEQLREEQLVGAVTTREAAIRFARGWSEDSH